MARIGLPYGVFAPIVSEPTGGAIEYGAPTVFDAAATGKMIEANVSYEHTDNPLYGGDGIAENDNSIIGGTLAVGTTSLPPAARVAILGHEVNGTTFHENADPSPAGGFWYVTAEIEGGVKKWYGYQIHKTQLAMAEGQRHHQGRGHRVADPGDDRPDLGCCHRLHRENQVPGLRGFQHLRSGQGLGGREGGRGANACCHAYRHPRSG